MLIDVTLSTNPDPILAVIAHINSLDGDPTPVHLSTGLYQCQHWNFEQCVAGVELEQFVNLGEDHSYGVCDSPDQFLGSATGQFVRDSPRKFVVALVRICRQNQPAEGGWRWHKWGPYIGLQKPTHEYLYDDDHIEEVWTYSVYELVG